MKNTLVNSQAVTETHAISVFEIIFKLKGLNESRIKAFNFYPNSISQAKWDACNIIRQELNEIPKLLTRRLQVQAMLRLHNHFLAIQPHTTTKLRDTYLQSVAIQMDACRNFLKWRAQGLR